jgi:bisphosphoglycerate-independent phosphoglycerate mutase (AlkP superfamily)
MKEVNMYLDAMFDKDDVLVFNCVPDQMREIAGAIVEESQKNYTIRRGEDLRTYSIGEYLDQ